jgi:hypothetical protein
LVEEKAPHKPEVDFEEGEIDDAKTSPESSIAIMSLSTAAP